MNKNMINYFSLEYQIILDNNSNCDQALERTILMVLIGFTPVRL